MTPHEQRPIERVTQARKRVEMTTERADFPEDKYMHEIHRLKTQRDEFLAACEALLSAVKSSDYSGISCDDVAGGNWFDRRDACIDAIRKARGSE